LADALGALIARLSEVETVSSGTEKLPEPDRRVVEVREPNVVPFGPKMRMIDSRCVVRSFARYG
jgi:hypothetical protein